MSDFWDELLDRTLYIRNQYLTRGITIKTNEGLFYALQIAADIAKCRGNLLLLQYDTKQASESVLMVFSLSENIKICTDAHLNIKYQLCSIVTGTINYGTPKINSHDYHFKDFEYEIFLAAAFSEQGLAVEFLDACDPKGEMICEGIIIEAKHPDTFKNLKKYARKFNDNLVGADKIGIFAVALEDVFELGNVTEFANSQFYTSWLADKHDNFAADNAKLLEYVGEHTTNIAGVIFTQSKLRKIGNEMEFNRLGNVCIFDTHISQSNLPSVLKVGKTFNPDPIMFSVVWNNFFNEANI